MTETKEKLILNKIYHCLQDEQAFNHLVATYPGLTPEKIALFRKEYETGNKEATTRIFEALQEYL